MENEELDFTLMAYVDGELSEEERARFEGIMAESPEIRAEVEAYEKMRKAARELRFRRPPPEFWDEYPRGVLNRIEHGFGLILVLIGTVTLLAAGMIAFLCCAEVGLEFKIPVCALGLGMVILLLSVMRRRWKEAKTDPYKEIIR